MGLGSFCFFWGRGGTLGLFSQLLHCKKKTKKKKERKTEKNKELIKKIKKTWESSGNSGLRTTDPAPLGNSGIPNGAREEENENQNQNKK